MRIEVSGRQFHFPPQCACCSTQANGVLTTAASKSTGKKVVHTTTNTWDFPYCSNCIRHVQLAQNARTAATSIVVGALVLALYCWISVGGWLAMLLCLVGIGGAAFAYNSLMSQARALSTPQCACINPAVAFLGWNGSCNTFEISSSPYALAFMVANQKKLVNLSPQAQQWLQANGYGAPSNQAQSARRYIR